MESADSKNVLISVQDYDFRDINFKGIKFLLDRALDNVISNAIRHSPEHGTVEVSCETDKKYFYLEIWDQGEGVSEDSYLH